MAFLHPHRPDCERRAARRTAPTLDRDSSQRGQRSEARPSGPIVLDRYRLHKPLGTGGFGTVWMARDERLERDVAVKVLARERIVDGRFEREARAAARLSHPGIVTLYEAAVDDDGAYLVSELVRGDTLSRLAPSRIDFRTATSLRSASPSATRSTTLTPRASCTGTSSPRMCSYPSTQVRAQWPS